MVNVPHTTGLALTISIVNIAISVINTIPSPNPIVKEVHVNLVKSKVLSSKTYICMCVCM